MWDTEPRRILVVVDRGGSGAAVRYGASESLRTGRPLRLVHAAPPGDSWLRTVGLDALRRSTTMALSEVVGKVPVDSALVAGGLHAIAAEATTAAVVVIEQLPAGSHRTPTASVAGALGAVTDTPVVVIPAEWVERHRGVVTVGLDPTTVDDVAIRAAILLARLRKAVLRVVAGSASDADRADIEARLERWGGDGCDVAVELTSRSPAEALEEASASSDLLVVGRHRPRLPEDSRLSEVMLELLVRLRCPVLLTAPGHVSAFAGRTPAARACPSPAPMPTSSRSRGQT